MSNTIFARIVSGEIPTDFVYEDEHCVAINDINPLAPVHVARQLGVEEAFRLMVNNGAAAGMTVPHLHLHILAGRSMSEASLASGLDT